MKATKGLRMMYFCVKHIHPVYIISLSRLRHLSVLDNELEEVPVELGHLTELTEVNLTSNNLSWLPPQLYKCKDLTKLHVARNKLTSLPEVGILWCDVNFFFTMGNLLIQNTYITFQGIVALAKLRVLDVAGNKLYMFPAEVQYTFELIQRHNAVS